MTTLSLNNEPNYAARVLRVNSLVELPGLDNLRGVSVDGFMALVSKDTPVGSLVVAFVAESQLSDEFLSQHNLYRHTYEFERAIMSVCKKNPAFAKNTLLKDCLVTAIATIASTGNTDLNPKIALKPFNERESGKKPTQNALKPPNERTDNGTLPTSESDAPSRSTTQKSVSLGVDTQGESTLLPSTVSLPNGMTSDTATWEDVANFVENGGKFSALITAILRGWYGDSSVKDATLHLVALETTRLVFDALSPTSNGLSFLDFAKNADPSKAGYIEDNRRVRAVKFRGHMSSALVLDASILGIGDEHEGALFDTIDGVQISQKYVIRTAGAANAHAKAEAKAFKRVDSKMLPEHIDTSNYWRNKHLIPDDAFVTVTQKLHGTSIRIGNTIVRRELKWWERLLVMAGVKIADTDYDVVFGSRKVIKDAHNPNQNHFYSEDIWTREGEKYAHLIPKNVIVYGELIGWVGENSPIQGGYTYNVPNGEAHLYVYRVAVVTADGHLFDLSWQGVKDFCTERGLKYVPELWSGRHSGFIAEDWLDIRFANEYEYDETVNDGYSDPRVGYKYPQAVPLSKDSPVDEGVVVRWDGQTPTVLKAKSPIFLGFETASLDRGEVDLESAASEDAGG